MRRGGCWLRDKFCLMRRIASGRGRLPQYYSKNREAAGGAGERARGNGGLFYEIVASWV